MRPQGHKLYLCNNKQHALTSTKRQTVFFKQIFARIDLRARVEKNPGLQFYKTKLSVTENCPVARVEFAR